MEYDINIPNIINTNYLVFMYLRYFHNNYNNNNNNNNNNNMVMVNFLSQP